LQLIITSAAEEPIAVGGGGDGVITIAAVGPPLRRLSERCAGEALCKFAQY
jgi:hypothetical protein